METPGICRIDDDRLCWAVEDAASRVVFVAPGVSLKVAEALAAAWHRLGSDVVSVILDADAEVCRLGYGCVEGLQLLQATAGKVGSMICHQPGIRIGILIADDETLIYSPTPRLVEAGGTRDDQPNGIVLDRAPDKIAAELGVGARREAAQRIGLDKLPDKQLKSVADDLAKNPPMPFDVSRHVRVFNSQVEFVEFSLDSIQLQRKEIPIPKELAGFAKTNVHSLFRLDPGQSLQKHKEALEEHKKELDKRYTRPMKGFGGSIIKRTEKADFEKDVDDLKKRLDEFRNQVGKEFASVAAENKAKLYDILLPRVLKEPPASWQLDDFFSDRDSCVMKRLKEELDALFSGMTESITSRMQVRLTYKGVTYECLQDKAFIDLVKRAFPELPWLHEEYNAARASEVPKEGSYS